MKFLNKISILIFTIILFLIILELVFFTLEKNNKINYDKSYREQTWNFTNQYFSYDSDVGLINKNVRRINDNLFKPKKSIVVLGDSVSAGYCSNTTYSQLLTDMINQNKSKNKSLKYSVINLAVSGYNTFQEYAVYKKIDFNPKITILQFFYNDFQTADIMFQNKDSFIDVTNNLYDYKLKIYVKAFISHSSLFRFVYFKLGTMNPCAHHSTTPECMNFNKEIVKDYILKIKELAEKKNSTLIIIYVPTNEKINNTNTFKNYFNKYSMKLLKEISKKTHTTIIDLTYEFSKEDVFSKKLSYCNKYDNHPNNIGHRIIAEKIYEELINKSLI